jgi:DNA-binding ferritin-like protein
MDHLVKAAILLRAGQLYAHHCHNNVRGSLFHSDHKFFGNLYPKYESAYDTCVERYIGLTNKALDTLQLGCDAMDLLSDLPKDGGENNHAFYQGVLHIEQALCKYIESCTKAPMSEGTRQMLGNLADESEVRQYKIKQRLKG